MGYPSFEKMRESRGPSPADKKKAMRMQYEVILEDVAKEIERSQSLGFGLFNSAHEGYAIMLEEFDELKAHVWVNQKKRDLTAMRKEAVQVAAMAVKFIESMDAGAGRV